MKAFKGNRTILTALLAFVMIFSLFLIMGIASNADTVAEWKTGTTYNIGDVVSYSGQYYKCTMAHTSNDAWTPNSAPTLWTKTDNNTPTPVPSGIIVTGDFAPWQEGKAYKVGDKVEYQGEYYQCLTAHTGFKEWGPATTPAVWAITDGPTPTPKPTLDPSKPTPTPYPTMPPEDPTKRKIVGYYTEWSIYGAHQAYYPKNIPWDKVTHINYAFAKTSGGKIALFDVEAATQRDLGDGPTGCLGQFKKLKTQYPNVKVLISVGGWTLSRDFHDIALTQQSRDLFAYSCVQFIKRYNLDGVDIDWEYPNYNRDPDKVDNINDTGCVGGPEDKHNYTLLLKTLREYLDEAGYNDKKRYLLTIAAPAGYDKICWTEPEVFQEYLDYMNLMTYDYHGAWEKTTGHLAPLFESTKNPDQSELNKKYVTDWTVNEYLRLGVSAYKLTMGVPYYTRGWQGVKGGIDGLPGLFASAAGGANGIWDGGVPAGTHPFYYVKANLENTGGYKKYTDPESKTPYVYNETQGLMFTYEDETSLGVKCDYVINKNLGGAMFWEFSGDYPSKGSTLTDVIFNKFKGAPPVVVSDNPKPTPSNTPTPTPSISTGYKVSGNIDVDFEYAALAAPVIKSGFKVEIVGTSYSALTDENGYFEIKNVPASTSVYSIKISKRTFLTRTITNVLVNKDIALGNVIIWGGDYVEDGVINMADIMEVAKYYNSAKGDTKYNEGGDLNKDGAINMTDMMIIVKHFNKGTSDYPNLY